MENNCKVNYPYEAGILITNRCNSRCAACNIWKLEGNEDLAEDAYMSLPRSLRKITLSGGEPFLAGNLTKIIESLNKKCNNPRWVISTNGLMPNLAEKKLKEIIKISSKVGVRVSI